VDTTERYRIEEELGAGGMGVVYRAVDTTLGRPVAVKKLHPHLTKNKDLVARFKAEARAAARLEHPNIVAVHDVGEHDGDLFFTMQYVEGESLRSVLDRVRVLPIDQLLWVGQQLASALDYVHRMGVVHRDIKPENVLLDTSGNVRVTDFGIARAADGTRLTATGTMMGTPEYMSPEQIRGVDVDHRTDIYSLGVLLFEMGAGQVPFSAETPIAVAMLHCEQPPPDPSSLQPTFPPWLSTVTLRCLSKSAEQRFTTAGEVTEALRSQQPVQVPTPVPQPVPKGETVYAPVSGTPPPATPPPAAAPPAAAPPAAAPPAAAPPIATPPPIAPTPLPQTPTPAPASSRSGFPVLPVAIGGGLFALVLVALVAVLAVVKLMGPDSPVLAQRDRGSAGQVADAEAVDAAPVETGEEAVAHAEVRARYDDWVRAWESRDVERYMAFYSSEVEIKRANKPSYDHDTLRSRMSKNFDKQGYIRIDDGEPTMSLSGDELSVVVWHDYDSSTWWDNGTKRMTWRRSGSDWKIVEESFEQADGGSKR
jgi:eukaryotic-like serine/threonine-protein kinase